MVMSEEEFRPYPNSSDEDVDNPQAIRSSLSTASGNVFGNIGSEPIAGPSGMNERRRVTNVPSVCVPGVRRGTSIYYDGIGYSFHKEKETRTRR